MSDIVGMASKLVALRNENINYDYLVGTPGHHVLPQYMCGASQQKLVKPKLGDHTLLHVELDLLARTLELVGFRTAKLLKARGKNAKVSINDIGKRKLGRVAISGALGGFYSYFDWMDKGVPTIKFYDSIEDGFNPESNRFINQSWSCK